MPDGLIFARGSSLQIPLLFLSASLLLTSDTCVRDVEGGNEESTGMSNYTDLLLLLSQPLLERLFVNVVPWCVLSLDCLPYFIDFLLKYLCIWMQMNPVESNCMVNVKKEDP
jgi:hypothetical protein